MTIQETSINIISEGTRIEGEMTFHHVTRVHGTLSGKIHGSTGSTLILCENSIAEGDIDADTLFVDGYVKGNVRAKTKVVVSGTGRVLGNITAPILKIDFGAHFEGKSITAGREA